MTVESDRDVSPELKMTGVATTFRFLEPKDGAGKGKAPGVVPGKGGVR
jgi:hypothetical protein